ncbi:MAG: PhnD/SsuA/transferrin family substrate-binding protein [Candidatus Riflebacteria bacterium]|nr:PhnD/SsuA/transferrin family substrate-binding protein [Candidatus Riflebacteria bacterium]
MTKTKFILFLLIFQIGIVSLFAQSENPSNTDTQDIPSATASSLFKKHLLRIANSSTILDKVDLQDSKVALKVWSDLVSEEENTNFVTEVSIVEGLDLIKSSLENNSVDMVSLSSLEYLELKEQISLIPAYFGTVGSDSLDTLLLIVHKESNINSFQDLKGKNVKIEMTGSGRIPMIWLDTELLRQGLPPAEKWCQSLKLMDKVAQAVHPVFFRQADACVVRKFGFQTMVEMNPQLGNQLKIIGQSPPYVRAVVCFRAGYGSDLREILTRSAVKLHTKTKGKQILTLFKLDRIILFQEELFDSIRKLIKEYNALKGKN